MARIPAAVAGRFDHVPGPIVERARIVPVPVLPPAVGAMTLGPLVLLRRDRRDDATLLAHELVHARQWAEYGAVGFLVRYLSAYVAGLVRHRSHRLAYRAIPFEVEARRETAAWLARQASPQGP